MKTGAAVVVLLGLVVAARADDKVEAKGDKIEARVYDRGYFESNKSSFRDAAETFLAITDLKTFESLFGKAATMGKKIEFLPKDAFEKQFVVAVIKRGNAPWTYKVDRVTADGETVYVQYQATSGGATTARFASPLIIALDRGKYKTVVFLENGKKAGSATLGK